MADIEAPVEQAAASPAERSNEPIVYDESLLIIVKGKVQQPKQPDHTESRLFIQKLQAEITKRGDRIKEIKSLEEQLRTNAKGASSGNKEFIGKLKELRDQRSTIIRQKTAIRDELVNGDSEREAIRAEMRTIRDKSRHYNADKIEQDLKDYEFRLAHETLTPKDEKRTHDLIAELKAARPDAKRFSELDSRLKDMEPHRASILARLKEADGVIAQLDVQIKAANEVLDEARAKSDAHAADLPSLQVEKKENYEIMVTLRAKIDELRKANDEEYQEYIKRDRAYRGWKRADQHKKYLERQKEREERERSRVEADTGAAPVEAVLEPYSGEIFTCDQLLGYLRSFTAVKEEVKQEAKQVEAPAGLKPFKRQEVVDDMFTGVPKKAPVSKGKPAAKAPEPVKPAEAKPKAQKLNHTLDMLKVFLQLNVEPPTTTAGIPATIEKVEQRKVEYKQKQEDAKRAPPPKPARANGHAAKAAKDAEEAEAADAEVAEPEQEDAAEPAEEVSAVAEAAPAQEEAEAQAEVKAEEVSAVAESAPQQEQEEEPAAPAPAAEAAETQEVKEAEVPSEATGVDLKLTVEDDTVSVSVTAA